MLRGRPRRTLDLRSARGMSAIELGAALAIIGIILTLSWGWQGSITRRRVQNAAYLLEGDLRLTQQTAISTSGNGPQAELCLRNDGYDVYTVVYQDPVGRSSPVAGARVKAVNAGQEFANGIQITPDASATYACTADNSRKAVVYQGSGSPEFPDSNPHTVTVTLGGQTRTVTIQPATGLATVGP
jgi:type II secretory pathway pseudopilin PulG